MTESELEKYYLNHIDKFSTVLSFVKKHQSVKSGIEIIFSAKVLINNESAKEKLRLIFIDTLNAAGGNNLHRNGKSAKHFKICLNQLADSRQVNLVDFYQCIDPSIGNASSLLLHFNDSKQFPNFGKKKAALFLSKLFWLQQHSEPDNCIFTNFTIKRPELIIPVDIVIICVLNKIFNLSGKLALDQMKDFDVINTFFKSKLEEDFFLIEDFWFWGYFATSGSGKDRKFGFNEDKFYMSDFIKPTQNNRQILDEFATIMNS